MRHPLLAVWATLVSTWFTCAAHAADPLVAAQAYGRDRPVTVPSNTVQPNGLLVCEAEEFQIRSPGWQARPWGENYYAATFANSFLSRKAFLGAPADGPRTVAERQVVIPAAGKYLVLARYEAAYRFETQFRLQVEQGGKLVLDRVYGARDNLKIWAFSQKLKKEIAWDWGAVENVVWEGHDAVAELQPGPAVVRLIADPQTGDAARRNVDLVLLTTDVEGVQNRIEKEAYLPLDGLLTQAGDVFVRVQNLGSQPLKLVGGSGPSGGLIQEHSPYWVHLRQWPKFEPVEVAAAATSDWIEIGSWLDTLNDGQLTLNLQGDGLHYALEFSVKNAAGAFEPISKHAGREPTLPLAFHADTRYSRLLRHQEQVLFDLLAFLKSQPAFGRAPQLTPVYAQTFAIKGSPEHQAAAREFRALFGISDADLAEQPATAAGPRGYIDVRSVPTEKLVEYCQKLGPAAQQILVVSLGDEIGLPTPSGPLVNDEFRAFLQAREVKPTDLDPAAGNDWSKVAFSPDPQSQSQRPGLYYWSMRYRQHYGIQEMKKRTDILRAHLPKAHIGANFSPHHGGHVHAYLGEVFQWVSCFRDDGMTLPWSEDYIWQVPVGSPQMNHISLDLARAGQRGKPDRKSLFYVMPHSPGNSPQMWRRLFYGALGHGMTILNLFEFQPVQVAYTENHSSDPHMYATVLRGLRELGTFEDLVQSGQVRTGQTGLWCSETADIWNDNAGSFAAAKRALYTAIRHQQTPLDIVVEQDAADGTLANYRALYLTDAHVSAAASRKIAAWVESGGRLFATAGAGMFDERNQPNTVLRGLLGVEQTSLDAPPDRQIGYIKQDLPFAQPLAVVNFPLDKTRTVELPAFGARSRIEAGQSTVLATFADGGPAIVDRKVNNGSTFYCAFLPSLAYYQPAIPRRPVDRGTSDDSMAHFLPTEFDAAARMLIRQPIDELPLPVRCSQPLVESMIIDAPQGTVIPLVNWTSRPIERLQVTLRGPFPAGNIALASGAAVQVDRAGDTLILTFDLKLGDALILRK